jgi:hypothetical protein
MIGTGAGSPVRNHVPGMGDAVTCTECGKRPAVTRDGRHLCKSCLRVAINRATPIPNPRRRTRDERQASEYEASPWDELNVRRMEDCGHD